MSLTEPIINGVGAIFTIAFFIIKWTIVIGIIIFSIWAIIKAIKNFKEAKEERKALKAHEEYIKSLEAQYD